MEYFHCDQGESPRKFEKSKIIRSVMDWVYYFHGIIVFYCVANFLSRIVHLIVEYIYYQPHYPDSLHESVFKVSFHYETAPAVIAVGAIIFVLIFWNLQTYRAFLAHNITWSSATAVLIGLVAVILIGFESYDLKHKHWLRDPKVLDYGSGMAQSYYNGYLNIIGPSYGDNRKGIVERMEQYEAENKVLFPIKKLFIIIPEKFFVPPRLTEHNDDERLLVRASLEALTIDRAGVKSRPYQNSVYSIRRTPNLHENNTSFWYMSMEGATPIVSYLESLRQSNNSMMDDMKHEILIKFRNTLQELINGHEETRGKFDLILYNSDDDLADVIENRINELITEKSNKTSSKKKK